MAIQKTDGNELLVPESSDDAATFLPAIESNFEKLNKPKAAEIEAVTASGWTNNGDGTFTKSVTLPSGFTIDNTLIQVRDSGGDMIYPTIEKTASTTFDMTKNDANAVSVLYSK